MTPFILSQILAGATLVTGMAAFQFKERKTMLRAWSIAATFAAIHFYLLGSTEASLLIGLTAIRFVTSSFSTDSRLMYLFMVLSVIGFALVYESPVSFLALAATLIGTAGSFHGSGKAVRYSLMGAEILWGTHNILIWSPVAVAMEALFFSSNLLGLLRHRETGKARL